MSDSLDPLVKGKTKEQNPDREMMCLDQRVGPIPESLVSAIGGNMLFDVNLEEQELKPLKTIFMGIDLNDRDRLKSTPLYNKLVQKANNKFMAYQNKLQNHKKSQRTFQSLQKKGLQIQKQGIILLCSLFALPLLPEKVQSKIFLGAFTTVSMTLGYLRTREGRALIEYNKDLLSNLENSEKEVVSCLKKALQTQEELIKCISKTLGRAIGVKHKILAKDALDQQELSSNLEKKQIQKNLLGSMNLLEIQQKHFPISQIPKQQNLSKTNLLVIKGKQFFSKVSGFKTDSQNSSEKSNQKEKNSHPREQGLLPKEQGPHIQMKNYDEGRIVNSSPQQKPRTDIPKSIHIDLNVSRDRRFTQISQFKDIIIKRPNQQNPSSQFRTQQDIQEEMKEFQFLKHPHISPEEKQELEAKRIEYHAKFLLHHSIGQMQNQSKVLGTKTIQQGTSKRDLGRYQKDQAQKAIAKAEKRILVIKEAIKQSGNILAQNQDYLLLTKKNILPQYQDQLLIAKEQLRLGEDQIKNGEYKIEKGKLILQVYQKNTEEMEKIAKQLQAAKQQYKICKSKPYDHLCEKNSNQPNQDLRSNQPNQDLASNLHIESSPN